MTTIDEVKVRWTQDEDGLACVAVATVSYQINDQRDRRLQALESGGLYGIDSEGDLAYLAEIACEQLDDLREHLEHFGIKPDRHEWAQLITESPSALKYHKARAESTQEGRSPSEVCS